MQQPYNEALPLGKEIWDFLKLKKKIPKASRNIKSSPSSTCWEKAHYLHPEQNLALFTNPKPNNSTAQLHPALTGRLNGISVPISTHRVVCVLLKVSEEVWVSHELATEALKGDGGVLLKPTPASSRL